VVLVFGLLLLGAGLWRKPAVRKSAAQRPRPLKPKTGAVCPLCRAEQGATVDEGKAAVPPRPWREGRSRRGRKKGIQDLKCQACGHKFTVRRHTVLYRLKTHSARVAETLTFLVEGGHIASTPHLSQGA
jgi:transposase-like protein